MESMGRGVLGPPVKPGDDRKLERREQRAYAFFFTSLMLENVMPSARSLV
jgi:hypothetical protein